VSADPLGWTLKDGGPTTDRNDRQMMGLLRAGLHAYCNYSFQFPYE